MTSPGRRLEFHEANSPVVGFYNFATIASLFYAIYCWFKNSSIGFLASYQRLARISNRQFGFLSQFYLAVEERNPPDGLKVPVFVITTNWLLISSFEILELFVPSTANKRMVKFFPENKFLFARRRMNPENQENARILLSRGKENRTD